MAPAEDFTELSVGLAVLEALDPNEELTREELDVRAWRFSQLVEHGYDIEDAMEVARAVDVDLEDRARTRRRSRLFIPARGSNLALIRDAALSFRACRLSKPTRSS